MILGIIIGILIWNVVCCIVINTIGGDNICAAVGCGIVGCVCIVFENIFNEICYFIKGLRYKSALIDPNGKPCYCKPLNGEDTAILFEKGYKWNESLREKYNPEDGWDMFDCINKDIVNVRYTPVKIAKAESAYKLNLRKILKTP